MIVPVIQRMKYFDLSQLYEFFQTSQSTLAFLMSLDLLVF